MVKRSACFIGLVAIVTAAVTYSRTHGETIATGVKAQGNSLMPDDTMLRDLFDRWERVWHDGQYDAVKPVGSFLGRNRQLVCFFAAGSLFMIRFTSPIILAFLLTLGGYQASAQEDPAAPDAKADKETKYLAFQIFTNFTSDP